MTPLPTPRRTVELRALTRPDLDVVAGWGDDEEFVRAAGWTPGVSRGDRVSRLLPLLTSPPPDLLRLGAWEGEALVGYVDLRGDGVRRQLGYLVGPRERWGRGLGTALARAGMAHGFDVLGVDEVWAQAAVANTASVRILRRVGMSETGVVRRAADGRRVHRLQLATSATEWRSRDEGDR